MLASLGAALGSQALAGCNAVRLSGATLPNGTRDARFLAFNQPPVESRVSFPLWKTATRIDLPGTARGREQPHTGTICPQSTFTCGGAGDGVVGPSGNPPDQSYSNSSNTSYSFRSDNATSLYDSSGSLVAQSQTTLLSDYSFNVCYANAEGNAVTYSMPRLDSMPLDAWFSVQGSQCYLSSASHTGTMNGADGVTYTFWHDSNNDLVIHTNDGTPDTVLPVSMIVSMSPRSVMHTAGIACNAASFAFGFFGAGLAVSAIGAVIGARGAGSGKILASATGLITAMYNGATAVCQHTSW